jgi:kumamolisin
MAKHILKGSEREPLNGARSLGKADPAERLEVSVLLRRRAENALHARLTDLHRTSGRPMHLKREELSERGGVAELHVWHLAEATRKPKGGAEARATFYF